MSIGNVSVSLRVYPLNNVAEYMLSLLALQREVMARPKFNNTP
jgi:hypothetical protein